MYIYIYIYIDVHMYIYTHIYIDIDLDLDRYIDIELDRMHRQCGIPRMPSSSNSRQRRCSARSSVLHRPSLHHPVKQPQFKSLVHLDTPSYGVTALRRYGGYGVTVLVVILLIRLYKARHTNCPVTVLRCWGFTALLWLRRALRFGVSG